MCVSWPSAPGAVAANRCLHVDEAFLAAIKDKIVQVAYVTLHVGAGTFQPVHRFLDKHIMHHEWCAVPQETVDVVNQTKQNKSGRIIAVGTTCVRTLESAVDENGLLTPFVGNTNLFIKPGFQFNIVQLITLFICQNQHWF